MTQAKASTTLDLPEPLGPTTAVMPGSKWNVVADAKDLNPLRVRLFRCTSGTPRPRARSAAPGTGGRGTAGGTSAGKAEAEPTGRSARPTPGADGAPPSRSRRGMVEGTSRVRRPLG